VTGKLQHAIDWLPDKTRERERSRRKNAENAGPISILELDRWLFSDSVTGIDSFCKSKKLSVSFKKLLDTHAASAAG
jgi:hypothetical protein